MLMDLFKSIYKIFKQQLQLLHSSTIKFIFRFLFLITFLLFTNCKNKTLKKIVEPVNKNNIDLKYAKGFSISDYGSYKILEIKNPWPKSEKIYKYILASQKIISKNQFNINDFVDMFSFQ